MKFACIIEVLTGNNLVAADGWFYTMGMCKVDCGDAGSGIIELNIAEREAFGEKSKYTVTMSDGCRWEFGFDCTSDIKFEYDMYEKACNYFRAKFNVSLSEVFDMAKEAIYKNFTIDYEATYDDDFEDEEAV